MLMVVKVSLISLSHYRHSAFRLVNYTVHILCMDICPKHWIKKAKTNGQSAMGKDKEVTWQWGFLEDNCFNTKSPWTIHWWAFTSEVRTLQSETYGPSRKHNLLAEQPLIRKWHFSGKALISCAAIKENHSAAHYSQIYSKAKKSVKTIQRLFEKQREKTDVYADSFHGYFLLS